MLIRMLDRSQESNVTSHGGRVEGSGSGGGRGLG